MAGFNRKAIISDGFKFKSYYFIILALIVGALIAAFSIYGLHRSRENMLSMMKRNGATLLESLSFNARTIIDGSVVLEEAIYNSYIRSLDNIQAASQSHKNSVYFLRSQVYDAEADGAVIIENRRIRTIYPDEKSPLGKFIASNIDTLISLTYNLDQGEYQSILLQDYQGGDITAVGTGEPGGTGYFLFKVGNLMFPGWERFSIKNLIDTISREPGIEYVLLQNYDGIIFASRKLEQRRMLKIREDPFLENALEDSVTASRITKFFDRDVLEVVRPFHSQEQYDGLFRLGLSLDSYNELVTGYRKRTLLITAIIIILIGVMIGVVFLFQRYSLISESLERMSGLYDELLSRIPSGVMELNDDFKVVTVNRAGNRILGLENKAVVGKNYKDILDVETGKLLNLDDGSSFIDEVEIADQKGNIKILSIVCSRMDYHTDIGSCYFIVFYDITELRKYQDEAKRNQRLKELGNMSAGVAHEIRNPLNAISMAVQRLKAEIPSAESEEAKPLLGHLESEAGRLNRIVEDFLLYARYTRQPGISDLKENVESVISLLRHQADGVGVKLQHAVPAGLKVALNGEDLKKALINLMVNSIDSCKDGGEVRVTAEVIDDAKVKVEVTDTGSGIAPEIIDSLFQPYVSGKTGGTGLGLAIVSRIIEDAGGSISAKNADGGGAVFTFIISKAEG